MAKFTGSKCKLMRREGTDLYLKSGSRSLETKCNLEKKPGQTGDARRAKNYDYSLQLREKKKLKEYMVCWKNSLEIIIKRLLAKKDQLARTFLICWNQD